MTNYSYRKIRQKYLEESVSFRNVSILTNISKEDKENVFSFITYNVYTPVGLIEICGLQMDQFYKAIAVNLSNKSAYIDLMNSTAFYKYESIICNINGPDDPLYQKLLKSNDDQVSFYLSNGYKNLIITKENKALSEYGVLEYYVPINFDMSLFLTKLRLYKHMKG